MAIENYRQLVDEICRLSLIPPTAVLYENTRLTVRDVDFSLHYVDAPGPGNVVLHGDFGPLPARRREAVLLRLLETNFYLFDGRYSSSFSHNEQTGRVLLNSSLALADTSATHLLGLMGHFAEYAQAWRQTGFLNDDSDQDNRPQTLPGRSTTLATGRLTSGARAL
ncbi:CesT family type III secretion system chaperone [Pseudomonas gingeri]|uniref:CesT family type III secretion system chaperone n=1 Tax=Pseudomonas gingeri TaxID=117681 RepID=UPI0015A0FBEF|nr:CesT family type III secretion system chaperone [Pseudomonas gingeri]NWA02082.1 CesT family type III secretion system chaperone [Pseudomonas gingeri]NWA18125.1 CesT family type III secretion system chaperone [Pseudomonas gingeri]NWA56294.1 CesT family type III secretion system chaperone [Pseudomonas gingeri]NWA98872.1 CesT family type III secretion system chaperone [Pseudomonas gingeri]NWB04809.1 CesT family type III secretion system chaperone [Pseudomonas gingeri]